MPYEKRMKYREILNRIDEMDDQTTISEFKSLMSEVVGYYSDLINEVSGKKTNFSEEASVSQYLFLGLMGRDEKAITRLGLTPGNLDVQDRGGSQWELAGLGKEKAGLGTPLRADAVTGSYLTGTGYYSEVMRLAEQASTMMSKVRKLDMEQRVLKIPELSTSVTLTWPTDESTAKTETNPTFGLIELISKTCAAWLGITEELEEDSLMALGPLWTELFSGAWGLEFDKQVLTANASPFTGILHDTGVNEVIMGTGKTSFSDVTFDDLLDLQDALTTEGAHIGAYYIMHRTVFNAIRRLKDDTGQPIYQRGDQNVPPTIIGTPYILSDVMPKITDSEASKAFIIYGNPKHWLYGDRKAVEVRRFGDTAQALEYDRIFWRFRVRAAFQPAVASAFSRLKTAAS